jgi:glycine/D-amino acid oxidase-like deaminating enzyme
MRSMMNRSIDLMEDLAMSSDNRINLSRHGYLYVTGDTHVAQGLLQSVEGEDVRKYSGSGSKVALESDYRKIHTLDGFDYFADNDAVRANWPFMSPDSVQAALFARRCGWCSAQQLGRVMYEEGGSSFIHGHVKGITETGGKVQTVSISSHTDPSQMIDIDCGVFVNAAGPWAGSIQKLIPSTPELPLKNEVHAKVSIFFSCIVLNDPCGSLLTLP